MKLLEELAREESRGEPPSRICPPIRNGPVMLVAVDHITLLRRVAEAVEQMVEHGWLGKDVCEHYEQTVLREYRRLKEASDAR